MFQKKRSLPCRWSPPASLLASLPAVLLLPFFLAAGEDGGPRAALANGDYAEAIDGFRKIVEAGGAEVSAPVAKERLEARRGWAEALRATGKPEEALKVLQGGEPSAGIPAALAGLGGRILREMGKPAEAHGLLAPSAADAKTPLAHRVECLVELGRADLAAGRNEDALKAFEDSIGIYKDMDPEDAEALSAETFVHWALALIGLNRYSEANDIMFSQGEEKDPKCAVLLLEMGRVFLSKYNFPDAMKLLQEAIGVNPNLPEARAAIAEGLLSDYGGGPDRFEKAEEEIRRALEVNPRLCAAILARGKLWLYDGNLPKAAEDFRKALAEDPSSLEARGLLATCHFLTGAKADFAQEEAAARAVNPKAAAFHHTIAMALEHRFRYTDAVAQCDKALELDKDYWPVYHTLAINCLRTGENARGRQFLEKSWEKDRFNVWVFNTRKLVKYMDESCTSYEEGGFVVYFPKEDAQILKTYQVPLLIEARASLEARYKMRLVTPIQVEDFSDHKWFSARTVGLPGFAAAGATFGRVVTLTTSKAIPQNWGVVAWHELAHVAALGLTGHRVPRWFTEGLSVYEEGLDRPHWARNFQRELSDAWGSGRLLRLAEIDFGFTKPKFPMQILISYYQGCMVVRLIVETWGFEKVLDLLKGWGAGKGTRDLFQDCLGLSLEQFDQRFNAYMTKWVESTGYRPRLDLDKAGLQALEVRTEAGPKDAGALCELAWAYLCAGNAVDAGLTSAKALEVDGRAGDALAIQGLLSLKDKKKRQALESFEKALQGPTRFAALCHERMGIILAEDKETRAKAAEHLEEAKKLSPLAVAGYPPQRNAYYKLAEIYEEMGDAERANLQMVELARFAVEDPECRLRIVQHANRVKDPALAVKYLEELLFINPFEPKVHQLLAKAAEEGGSHDLVIREGQILLGYPDTNPRSVRLAMAKAWLAKGNKEKAAQEARKVLEIDPRHEAAREILKKAG